MAEPALRWLTQTEEGQPGRRCRRRTAMALLLPGSAHRRRLQRECSRVRQQQRRNVFLPPSLQKKQPPASAVQAVIQHGAWLALRYVTAFQQLAKEPESETVHPFRQAHNGVATTPVRPPAAPYHVTRRNGIC